MESSSIVARSLAQIFQCATLSGATHKLTYIHIYTYVTDRWRQTPVAVFCPFSLGKYAAVRLPQDKYESTPFLCLTTQRNLLLLQTPPQTHTFLHTSQDETQLYSHFPNSVLKCRLLCFSLFFFCLPSGNEKFWKLNPPRHTLRGTQKNIRDQDF